MNNIIDITIPTVRIGEQAIARDGQKLRTLLGSCVAVVLFDARCKVGGLAHILLPDSRGKDAKPGKHVDTAVPQLIQTVKSNIDGTTHRLVAKIAGGASMFASSHKSSIGDQNVDACVELLAKLEIPIVGQHCGGSKGRRIVFDSANGELTVDVVGENQIRL